LRVPLHFTYPHLSLSARDAKCYNNGVRREILSEDEYYHVYNRGVDHRSIIQDQKDAERFTTCLDAFNTIEPVGSLYALSFETPKPNRKKLVDIISYCVNPNHFHFVLFQRAEKGISKLIQRLTGGYSWYFNNKYKRTGALFEGRFKAKNISENNYLLHVSAYVNLNDRVHKLSVPSAKLVRSSWREYTENINGICNKKIILDQFESKKDYGEFALSNLPDMLTIRKDYAELKNRLLE